MTAAPTDIRTEAQLQSEVIKRAKTLGWQVWHFSDSRKQIKSGRFIGDKGAKGWLDLVLVRERLIVVELKTDKKYLTPEQRACQVALMTAGVETYTWKPKQLLDGTIDAILSAREEKPYFNWPGAA